MNSVFSQKLQKYLMVCAIAIIFGLMYLLNKIYPIICEDWTYSFIWGVDEPTPIRSISDVIVSQYHHYVTWGGRSVAHAIAQILLALDPLWHDIINTLAYVLFVFVVYKIINLKNKIRVEILIITSLSLWFLIPELTSLTLWITYSSVYLWTTLLTVLFIYPYYKSFRNNSSKNSYIKSMSLFLFGIFAAWSNENLSFMLLAFLILLLLIMKYKKKRISNWMLFGLAGAIIGFSLLILAPGNFARMAVQPSTSFMILSRIKTLVLNYIYYLSLISAIYLSLFYFYYKKSLSENKSDTLLISALFFITAHLGALVMVAFPLFPARSLFGVITFIIIASGILFANIPLNKKSYINVNILIISTLTILFSFDYFDKYRYISYFQDFWHKREVHLQEQKSKGILDIVYTEDLVFKDGFILFDFKRFPNGWPNVDYARYYGVNSVVLKE